MSNPCCETLRYKGKTLHCFLCYAIAQMEITLRLSTGTVKMYCSMLSYPFIVVHDIINFDCSSVRYYVARLSNRGALFCMSKKMSLFRAKRTISEPNEFNMVFLFS